MGVGVHLEVVVVVLLLLFQVVHEVVELQVPVVEVEEEVEDDQKVEVLWVVRVLSNLAEVEEVSFLEVVVAYLVVVVLEEVPFLGEVVQGVHLPLVLLVVVALVVLTVNLLGQLVVVEAEPLVEVEDKMEVDLVEELHLVEEMMAYQEALEVEAYLHQLEVAQGEMLVEVLEEEEQLMLILEQNL